MIVDRGGEEGHAGCGEGLPPARHVEVQTDAEVGMVHALKQAEVVAAGPGVEVDGVVGHGNLRSSVGTSRL
ncbi:hypothetical protein D3C86_2139480 [compost metagenome]